MRNGVLKIFAALFGLGMLVSCANNKLTAEIDTLEIVFRPIVRPNTKLAYSDDKSFPATLMPILSEMACGKSQVICFGAGKMRN